MSLPAPFSSANGPGEPARNAAGDAGLTTPAAREAAPALQRATPNAKEAAQPAPSGRETTAAVQAEANSSLQPSRLRKPQNVFSPNKRLMVIGPTGAGKSSLLHTLGLNDGPVRKTERVRISSNSIDTPGEMLDIPSLYHALITNSAKAELILFVVDPTRKCSFPVRIAKALRAPVLGVVTKADLAGPEDMLRARKALKRAGVDQAVETSIVSGSGLEELAGLISLSGSIVR